MKSLIVFLAAASFYALPTHAIAQHEVVLHGAWQQQNHESNNHAHSDRLPTQPIHRSILSHRKRTILPKEDNNAAYRNDEGSKMHSLRIANNDRRWMTQQESNKNEQRTTQTENSNEHQEIQPDERTSSPSSEEEEESPLMKSNWWVKIHEQVGQSVYNYVPESRRAASSVVFTYRYNDVATNDGDSGRLLVEDGDGVGLKNTTNKQDEDPVKQVDNNSTVTSNEKAVPKPQQKDKHKNKSTTSATTQKEEEYMIISGGYTDHDWKTFPVYAFPISSSIATQSGQWIDLSPTLLEVENSSNNYCNEEDGISARERLYQETEFYDANAEKEEDDDPWKNAQHCPPSGRMGHASVIHNNRYLYVFGGLIYDEENASGSYGSRKKETFRLEDVPFVYRLDLVEMFEARLQRGGGGSMGEGNEEEAQTKVTGWQRIIPRVKPFPTPAGMSSTSAAEVLLTSINRGEMQGGLWSMSSPNNRQHDKFVMYGGLRIASVEYDGYGRHNDPSKFIKGETTFGSSSSSQIHSHKIVELPLGDIWAYDLVLDCWEKITNNYGRPVKKDYSSQDDTSSDDWWYDIDTSLYPRPRTAHAATVVGNDLILHGGMGWNEHTNDWDGSTDWEALDDMWIFNLDTRQWTRRWLFPLLVRSYHSLAGWRVNGDESMLGLGEGLDNVTSSSSWDGPIVAAFGGYTTGIDVFSGEELAYVFDDLLVSYPPPSKTEYDEPPSPWLKAFMDVEKDGGSESISTRYEHSAVLSNQGVLFVWGGSFQDTKNVKGVWMINIAGSDSTVNFAMAESDSIYNDYERTITALHTIVLMLMFMSISLTLLLGLTQRYQELVQQANDDAAVAAGVAAFAAQDVGNDHPPSRRGNGLHPEIIDTIPQKIYSSSENNRSEEGTEEGDCCPICLLEYEDGDELRVLPCEHYMHKSCLDAWLRSNPSCPSCRHSLHELVDDRPMMQLRTLRSRLSNNTALARFLGHDVYPEEGIEMTSDFSSGSAQVVDIRYVSSLALEEEDAAIEEPGDVAQNQGGDNSGVSSTQLSAMEELSNWRRERSRRRQLQRGWRGSRLASLRHIRSGHRRSRVPLADLDDE